MLDRFRIDLSRLPEAIRAVQARLALQCATSLLIAFVLMRLLPFPKPYWLVLTALIVTANSFGETAAKSLDRITGTVLGLLAGTLVWMAASGAPLPATGVIVVCVFAIFYERTARYRNLLFWLSLLLSLIFHLGDAPGSFYLARLADTLIGTAIAVLVTMVLLPVRTGDAVREQMATLLDLTAEKLQGMASVLTQPGPHHRDGRPGQLLDASEKIAALTGAEGLEALLLRRPRVEVRLRMDAAAAIGRCLLLLDELVPLLPGAEPGIPAALNTLAAAVRPLALSVRQGTAAPCLPGRDDVAPAGEIAAAAYRADRITLIEFQASLRLHGTLASLADAVDRLALSAPGMATPSPGPASPSPVNG